MGLKSYRLGKEAEERAVLFLEQNGFMVIERNFFSRFGEIDIIAKKDGVVHFIEVKFSTSSEPILAITPKKMRKILKTIDYYLLRHKIDCYQIDALLLKPNSVEIVENISLL